MYIHTFGIVCRQLHELTVLLLRSHMVGIVMPQAVATLQGPPVHRRRKHAHLVVAVLSMRRIRIHLWRDGISNGDATRKSQQATHAQEEERTKRSVAMKWIGPAIIMIIEKREMRCSDRTTINSDGRAARIRRGIIASAQCGRGGWRPVTGSRSSARAPSRSPRQFCHHGWLGGGRQPSQQSTMLRGQRGRRGVHNQLQCAQPC